MTSATATATKPEKLTKVERLKRELEAANAALAQEEPALLDALRKAEDELKAMRKAYDVAEKAATVAYEALRVARREEAVNLGLCTERGDFSNALLASLKAFVVQAGLPEADPTVLAREVVSRDVGNVPRVVELKKASDLASQVKDRAHRKWNVASCPGGEVSRLRNQLEVLRDRVRRLEAEIQKVPERNQQARERREDARREEAGWKQTASASALLSAFSFKAGE